MLWGVAWRRLGARDRLPGFHPLAPPILTRPIHHPCRSTTKIENTIALRCVQNADSHMVDCFVPDADRIAGG